MDSQQLNIDDPAEVAGYVDSGVFELEEWLRTQELSRRRRQAGLHKLMMLMQLVDTSDDD